MKRYSKIIIFTPNFDTAEYGFWGFTSSVEWSGVISASFIKPLEKNKKNMEATKVKIVSTLECPNLNDIRNSGNSTRQTDFAIQQLFNGFVVDVQEHHSKGLNLKSNENLLKKILDRLKFENRSGDFDSEYNLIKKINGVQILLKLERKD